MKQIQKIEKKKIYFKSQNVNPITDICRLREHLFNSSKRLYKKGGKIQKKTTFSNKIHTIPNLSARFSFFACGRKTEETRLH